MFKSRHEAGVLLAQKLQKYKGTDAVVLALPRGGVAVGRAVADALSLPLDIIATRKIGHPKNSEYAVGAVDATEMSVFDSAEVASIDAKWLVEEIEKQRQEARRRMTLYRGERSPVDFSGRIAILVDDGVATGFTMRLAVAVAQKANPKKVVVAVPVAPAKSVREIERGGADEIVLLEQPENFLGAVGAHYDEFEQVGDRKVVELLGL